MSRRKTTPLSALTLLLLGLLAATCREPAPHAGAAPADAGPTGVEPGKTFVVLASQAELRELRETVTAAGEAGEQGRWPVPREALAGRWLAEADRLRRVFPGAPGSVGPISLPCEPPAPELCTPDPETGQQQEVQRSLDCELSCQETPKEEGSEGEEATITGDVDATTCIWTCRLE